jgi:hypothetical protein
MSHDEFCVNIPCDCDPDDYGHMVDCARRCDCELIEAVRSHERAIRWEEKRISYLEGAERAYDDVLNLASDLAYEQGGCSAVHTCEFEQGVTELIRKLEVETGNLDDLSANEGDAACCVYEQGYSLREQVSEKYADSSLKDYKEHTFPSDWAGYVAEHTDDPALANLFRACAAEWGPGFVDFDEEARSARDIKITPIGRALLDMVERRLKDGGVLPLAPPAPDSNEREQYLKYEVEISDASDTHVPWCSELDCCGCVCMHMNTTHGICDDCGDEAGDIFDPEVVASVKSGFADWPAGMREDMVSTSREDYLNESGEEEVIRASVGVSRLLPPSGHAPWCRDLECWGCECDHLNISQGVCEDCGESSAEPTLPEAELEALRDAARAAANEGRYALRTCWVCNPAHEHLRTSDCLIECFGCGNYYYRGVRITDDSDSDNSEISEGEAIFEAGRVTGVLDSIKAITEAWEAHKGGDWDDAAQAFTLALDALLVTEEDGGDN